VTPIARDGQVVVSFDLSDGFTPEVRDAIQSGLSTTFSYDVDLRRGAALFDKTVAAVTVSGSYESAAQTLVHWPAYQATAATAAVTIASATI